IWSVWNVGTTTNSPYQSSDGIRTAAANRNCGRDATVTRRRPRLGTCASSPGRSLAAEGERARPPPGGSAGRGHVLDELGVLGLEPLLQLGGAGRRGQVALPDLGADRAGGLLRLGVVAEALAEVLGPERHGREGRRRPEDGVGRAGVLEPRRVVGQLGP